MIRLLSFIQLPEFHEARNPEKIRNIPEVGGLATALIGVGNQVLLIDVSSFRPKQGSAI
jgi:hypothetical protein